MQLPFDDRPAWWIAKDGRPALCVGLDGMPSYEHGNRRLVVFDLVVVTRQERGNVMFSPARYLEVALRYPGGFVSIHDGEAQIEWRPCLYDVVRSGTEGVIQGKGSQQELAWRDTIATMFSLIQTLLEQDDLTRFERFAIVEGAAAAREDAHNRAERLLRECLSPQQRIEYLATKSFRVRGGRTGNLYLVEPSNGFERIHKRTNYRLASYCLHPEHWIPDADVALATKFALEDPELEIETLTNAGGGKMIKGHHEITDADEECYRLELELI